MMMIFDLSDCEIDYDPDIDPDFVHTINFLVILPHLTKEKCVVLWAADVPEANNHDITDSHFQSSIATRVKLHADKRHVDGSVVNSGWPIFCCVQQEL